MWYGDDLGRYMAMSGSGERNEGGGLETVGDVVRDLLQKQTKLSRLIDRILEAEEEGVTERVIKLLTLHGQNASRIGRLLRDQKVVEGEDVDKLLAMLDPVLDEVAATWGIEL
jgi:hypothetical protein